MLNLNGLRGRCVQGLITPKAREARDYPLKFKRAPEMTVKWGLQFPFLFFSYFGGESLYNTREKSHYSGKYECAGGFYYLSN